MKSAGERDGIEDDPEAQCLVVAGNPRLFEGMVDARSRPSASAASSWKAAREAFRGPRSRRPPMPRPGPADLEGAPPVRAARPGRAVRRHRGGRPEEPPEPAAHAPSKGPGTNARTGASPRSLAVPAERLGTQRRPGAFKPALREVDCGAERTEVPALEADRLPIEDRDLLSRRADAPPADA